MHRHHHHHRVYLLALIMLLPGVPRLVLRFLAASGCLLAVVVGLGSSVSAPVQVAGCAAVLLVVILAWAAEL